MRLCEVVVRERRRGLWRVVGECSWVGGVDEGEERSERVGGRRGETLDGGRFEAF